MNAGLKRTSRLIKLMLSLQSDSQNSPAKLLETSKVSRRTLYRDFRTLQEAGIPCHYDRFKQCYQIDSGFYMPSPNLTEKEALSILIIVQKARKMLEVPFRLAALQAILKIENNLPKKVQKFCTTALKSISILNACPKPENSIDEKFEFLQEAIARKQILELTFNCKSRSSVTTNNFSPLHLLFTDSWYIVGRMKPSGQIQPIKLRDIEKLELTGKCYLADEKFSLTEHLGRAWSMLPEGNLYEVKLRFAPEMVSDVTSKQWHSTQCVTIQEDGSAILEFRVDGLSEIAWWIIGFADKVEVLAPHTLRKKIHNMATKIANKNKIIERKSDSIKNQPD